MTVGAHEEIARGKRFAFGRNWRQFLAVLNDARIGEAEASLRTMLEGATVSSFDYDPHSVACTEELRRRYFPDDPGWQIAEGSVLDEAYVRGKGQFDIVYSWGVLHHTGNMWRALANVCLPVAPGGRLFIAIYNDQRGVSIAWRRVKHIYCSSALGRALVCGLFIPYFVVSGFASDVVRLRNPLRRYLQPTTRGMSMFYDWFDWLGGLPFEVARPEAILRFYGDRGFVLRNLITAGGGLGNNQFVFVRQ